jgi:peptidoglycan/LPS O-acetylase OafA/YrhL
MYKKLHFQTLDSTRFFAFLMVFGAHLNITSAHPLLRFLTFDGPNGLPYFFVLSGFLITYILLSEKAEAGRIDIKKFFIRRCFRIWPLYFMMMIIIYFVFYTFQPYIDPHKPGRYLPDWRYSFTFLENYKMIFTHQIPAIAPITVFWSLCVEEHFYIIWMFLIAFIPLKRILCTFFICIIIANLYRAFIPTLLNIPVKDMRDVFAYLDFFAAGSIVGYFTVVKYEQLVNLIKSIPLYLRVVFIFFVISFALLLRFILPGNIFLAGIVQGTVMATLFALLIAIFIPPNSSLRIGDSSPFSYFGKISYGLYVYHIIILQIMLHFIIHYHFSTDNNVVLLFFMLGSITITILISYLSYKYIETPLFRLRDKFYGYGAMRIQKNAGK